MSSLDVSESSKSLDVETLAVGGDLVFDRVRALGSAGTAESYASATNGAGSAHAVGTAIGGSAPIVPGRVGSLVESSGNAHASGVAESLTPGGAAIAEATARGGSGAGVSGPGSGGRPGIADAGATSRALDDGEAFATSAAIGGAADTTAPGAGPYLAYSLLAQDYALATGGSAIAHASASEAECDVSEATSIGLGTGRSEAIAVATLGSVDLSAIEPDPDHLMRSTASAYATGNGDTLASATSVGASNLEVFASATGSGIGRVESVASATNVDPSGGSSFAQSYAWSRPGGLPGRVCRCRSALLAE